MTKEEFKEYLFRQPYQVDYQDIEFIDLIGTGTSYLSWELYKDIYDWKGKKVADLSCFHGYYGFKIAELGGIVTGYDQANCILTTARKLNNEYNAGIKFVLWKAGDVIEEKYDITLCLDSLPYYEDIEKTLQLMPSDIVLFDIRLPYLEVVKKYYNILKEKESHRGNPKQLILLCERKK